MILPAAIHLPALSTVPPMSEKTTPGEAFRLAREAQGKTLEDAHTKTGITLNVLRQLEADEANAVEAVYLRLAARAYAEFLGLDPEEVAAQIRPPAAGPALEGRVPVKIATSNAPRPVVAAKERKSTPLGRLLVLGAVGLVILLALVYVFEQMDRADRAVAPPVASGDSEADLAAEVKSDPVVVATEAEPAAAEPAAPVVDPADEPPPAQVEEGSEIDELVLDESLLLEEAPLVLELEARTSTWVRVKWDGGGRFEGTLPAGARRRWEAQQFITVLSGRPRGFHYWFQNELIDDQLTVNPSGVLNFRATLEGVHIYPQKNAPRATPADSSVSSPAKKEPQSGDAPASSGQSLSTDASSL